MCEEILNENFIFEIVGSFLVYFLGRFHEYLSQWLVYFEKFRSKLVINRNWNSYFLSHQLMIVVQLSARTRFRKTLTLKASQSHFISLSTACKSIFVFVKLKIWLLQLLLLTFELARPDRGSKKFYICQKCVLLTLERLVCKR